MNSLKRMLELGWDFVLWNTAIAGKIPTTSGKSCTPPTILVPKSMEKDILLTRSLVDLQNDRTALQLRQYKRLSIAFDELIDIQAISGGTDFSRNFDVIAASPLNSKVFSFLCKSADIDIISIDFSHRVSFPLNKKLV